MGSVHRRVVRSSPYRDTSASWALIVELLTRGRDTDARTELMSVAGVAASVIADQAPRDAAIVAVCDGPRTRIYCLYDEAAADESGAQESPLGYDPLAGDWSLSLPCLADDLDWVRAALQAKTSRITARGPDEAVAADGSQAEAAARDGLVLNPKGLFGS